MGSDIGHWDVPSFEHPLQEAYEKVEEGVLDAEQFKEFTFSNAVRFYAGDRADFFAGTTVEADVRRLFKAAPRDVDKGDTWPVDATTGGG